LQTLSQAICKGMEYIPHTPSIRRGDNLCKMFSTYNTMGQTREG